MIQNERQYRITQTKLREFEQELAALNPQDPFPLPTSGLALSVKAWPNGSERLIGDCLLNARFPNINRM
jgi:hypothetical protein